MYEKTKGSFFRRRLKFATLDLQRSIIIWKYSAAAHTSKRWMCRCLVPRKDFFLIAPMSPVNRRDLCYRDCPTRYAWAWGRGDILLVGPGILGISGPRHFQGNFLGVGCSELYDLRDAFELLGSFEHGTSERLYDLLGNGAFVFQYSNGHVANSSRFLQLTSLAPSSSTSRICASEVSTSSACLCGLRRPMRTVSRTVVFPH